MILPLSPSVIINNSDLHCQKYPSLDNKLCGPTQIIMGFQMALVVKNLPVNAGDIRDEGLIPE